MDKNYFHKIYLRNAFETAKELSQDPNTQTGAVITTPTFVPISRGANRLYYGLTFSPELIQRPAKYDNLIHAERDAIFTAIREGKANLLPGSTMYATWTPCYQCAEAVINAGIKRFITHQSTTDWYAEKQTDSKRTDWNSSIEKALNQLKKCGVEYICLNEPLGGVSIIFDNLERTP